MAIVVQWKRGYRARGSAEDVYREVEEIRAQTGDINVDEVIERAKNPESAMHNEYNWNVKQAALEHWRDTTRKMIRSIEVVRPEAPKSPPHRAFVQVTRAPEKEKEPPRRVYTDLAEALQDPVTRAEVLGRAINEAIAYRRKYAELQELASIFAAMDELIANFKSVG